MKVIHIATEDGGGAGMATCRLHQGLCNINVDSKIIVSRKIRNIKGVFEAKHLNVIGKLGRRLEKEWRTVEFKKYSSTISTTLETFSDDRVPGRDRLTTSLPIADVYNLHWVAGFLDYQSFFKRFPSGTPLVWRLPDMYPFTGGCHYSYECTGFTRQCGQCPELGSSDRTDISALSLSRKKDAFSCLNPTTTCFVGPSKWTQSEAKKSSLLQGYEVKHIPNGINCEVFKPRNKNAARELFALPKDDLVILFVSESITNNRKGFDLLKLALAQIDIGRPLTLAAIGSSGDHLSHIANYRDLGRIDNEVFMSFAYSAADIFVTPARAESFGQVVIEAMACGTPVIGFDTGGIPDMVRPGKTGLLARPEDVAGLSAAIETILRDDDMRARMSKECRNIAVKEYSLEIQASRYKELYEGLIETSHRLRNHNRI